MLKQLKIFLEMIRFEHTVFALPFAYLSMFLAAGGAPTWRQFFWITLAMIGARTVAFAVNRYADRFYDARNPRTKDRPIPSGKMKPGLTLFYGAVAALLLAVSAWQLNPLTLWLLPGALLFLVGYSYTKRFTWLSHWILGATDGLAAAGAWIGVTGSITWPPFLLWGAVTFWVGGFDLIYACQDTAVDREEKLYSVPAVFGNAAALRWSKISYLITLALLAANGYLLALKSAYWLGLAMTAGLLFYEHILVKPDDLSRLDVAFFNLNSYIAIILFSAAILGMVLPF